MTKKILLTISLFFLIPYTLLFADEGDIERLAVPEVQEVSSAHEEVIEEEPMEESIVQEGEKMAPQDIATAPTEESDEASTSPFEGEEQAEISTETQAPQVEGEATDTAEVQEQQSPEVPPEIQEQEVPSQEALEAKHAEESELREVGAGEEPVE